MHTHVRSELILLGEEGIHLAENIIRYGILKIKVNCCNLIHHIKTHNFLEESFKIALFTYTAKETWKEDCNSNNAL